MVQEGGRHISESGHDVLVAHRRTFLLAALKPLIEHLRETDEERFFAMGLQSIAHWHLFYIEDVLMFFWLQVWPCVPLC